MSRKPGRTGGGSFIERRSAGVDSHGVARLSGYVRLYDAGRVNSRPDIRVIHETPSTATMDADAGLGLVSAPMAMELAIKKAAQAGTGWVAIQNSKSFRHCGLPCRKPCHMI